MSLETVVNQPCSISNTAKIHNDSPSINESRCHDEKAPVVKKRSQVMEFCFWYFGSLLLFYILDRTMILFPGRSFIDIFPEGVSFRHVIDSVLYNPLYRNRMAFVGLGIILAAPMHYWRKFVKLFFVPLATRGSGLRPGTLKYDKFLEQCWLASHYLLVTLLEIYCIKAYTKHWPPIVTAISRHALFKSEEEHVFQSNIPMIQVVYLLQYSFYFLELATLVFDKVSRRRSDAFVYAIHHVLTVQLISWSYVFMSAHPGLLILFFHDVGDIFLPIAKCFVYTEVHARRKYSRKVNRLLELSGIVFFVCFLVAFFVARLIMLPIHTYSLLYNGAWSCRSYVASRDGEDVSLQPTTEYHLVTKPVCSARVYLMIGLCLLQPLHVYWFRLVLRVAYRAIGGFFDDERSDNDDYSDDDKDK